MMPRINLGQATPDLYKKVAELDQLLAIHIQHSGLAEGFVHLLKLRVSQINQCAFCIRLHTQDALKAGESIDRISLLNAWRETEHYNRQERASLTLIEAVTLISSDRVSDKIYFAAQQHLSDAQITAIEWIGILMNAWNRIAICSRYPVHP